MVTPSYGILRAALGKTRTTLKLLPSQKNPPLLVIHCPHFPVTPAPEACRFQHTLCPFGPFFQTEPLP